MPDRRHHRGPHPQDRELFAEERWADLRNAVADVSWLFSRGYALPSTSKIVGDRYRIEQRQMKGVVAAASADASLADRKSREVAPQALAGADIVIDGFNLIVTIEAALSGGVLIVGRDGCIRDMASMHGSYRRVEETQPAIELIGSRLGQLQPRHVHWLLDRPVSNSGRLRAMLLNAAERHGWPWSAELDDNVDGRLKASSAIVITADGEVLNGCGRWCNVTVGIVDEIEEAWVVRLGNPGPT